MGYLSPYSKAWHVLIWNSFIQKKVIQIMFGALVYVECICYMCVAFLDYSKSTN